MHTGGAAVADGIGLLDPEGNFGIPSNYDLWDVNEDGIPDRDQFELLTEILCMTGVNEHPTINFEEIRTTFEDNLTLYSNMINRLKEAEADMIAGAPALRQVGIDLGLAATAAGLIDPGPPITSDLLPPEVFGGELPDEWEGKTWEDLRYTLRETGDGINYLYNNNLIGSPTAPIWVLLDNTATAYIMAALMGLDANFTASLFSSSYFELLAQFLTLQQLDWSYIASVLTSHGLTLAVIADAEYAIDEIGLDTTVLPPQDALAITSNGEDALHGDVLWGESTLSELFNNNGGDVGSVWDEILTQLPDLPVGGFAALFVCATLCIVGGAARMRRRRQ